MYFSLQLITMCFPQQYFSSPRLGFFGCKIWLTGGHLLSTRCMQSSQKSVGHRENVIVIMVVLKQLFFSSSQNHKLSNSSNFCIVGLTGEVSNSRFIICSDQGVAPAMVLEQGSGVPCSGKHYPFS